MNKEVKSGCDIRGLIEERTCMKTSHFDYATAIFSLMALAFYFLSFFLSFFLLIFLAILLKTEVLCENTLPFYFATIFLGLILPLFEDYNCRPSP